MKSTLVIYVKKEKSLKNRIANLMHEVGLFKIVYEKPILDGAIMTVKGNSAVRFILGKLYGKKAPAFREPFKLK